jgi:hypothetical protein
LHRFEKEMILSPDQLHTVLEILDRQLALFVAESLGPEMLSDEEKRKLRQYGIDYESLYDKSKDLVTLNYNLGVLSQVLEAKETNNLTFNDLKTYLSSGQHIELTAKEIAVINNIKSQSLADIRANKGRIFNDINQIASKEFSNTRANQEKVIQDHIAEG